MNDKVQRSGVMISMCYTFILVSNLFIYLFILFLNIRDSRQPLRFNYYFVYFFRDRNKFVFRCIQQFFENKFFHLVQTHQSVCHLRATANVNVIYSNMNVRRHFSRSSFSVPNVIVCHHTLAVYATVFIDFFF